MRRAIMFTLRLSFVLMVLLVVTSSCFVNATFAKTSKEEATLALANAEETLVSAYEASLKAEQAGANVSSLLVQLNEAGQFLARARMAYGSGNFDEVSFLTNSCRSIGMEVENEATNSRNLAFGEGLQRMISVMVLSVVGIALIALGSLWTWSFLKKSYGTVHNS